MMFESPPILNVVVQVLVVEFSKTKVYVPLYIYRPPALNGKLIPALVEVVEFPAPDAAFLIR